MDFSLNEDHLALRDAVHRFCESEFPAQYRGNTPATTLTAQRRQALAELGVLGLPFAPEFGGSGQSAIETMLVAQALGQALADWTFVGSTVMAGNLLTRLGSPDQQNRWIPGLCSGSATAAVALYETGQRYDWRKVATRATRTSSGWVLNGHKTLVLGGDDADLLLVLAHKESATAEKAASACAPDLAVFAVDARAAGVQVQAFDTLDNRRAAHVSFSDVALDAGSALGHTGTTASGGAGPTSEQVSEAIDAMLDAACAALCAEAAGAVEALLIHTADHLRTRKQFGAPLAKFQVLQHRVADMAIALEQLKSMACAAAMAVQAGEAGQRRRLVSAAKVLAGQMGRAQGLAAIQLHGAMGMTDECRVGHYAKRLLVIGQLFGDAAWHLQSLQKNPV